LFYLDSAFIIKTAIDYIPDTLLYVKMFELYANECEHSLYRYAYMKKTEKNILFLCKCGGQISNHVHLDQMQQWAKSTGEVQVVAISNLLCAPKGKQFFSETIAANPVNNIIIAACSPKLHEKTFQDLSVAQGINMGKVHMANIREQCAWVTPNKQEATDKSISLVQAALNRSRYADPLNPQTMKVNTDILIIGGGIAGMQAALTIARAGRRVYLVEREISLGGTLIQMDEIAPNMECSPCLLAPLLAEVRDEANIEVITNAEIEQIVGFFGNFTATVRKKARYVKENCIGCEECFAVCPVSAPREFHNGMSQRQAIFTLFPGSVPAAAVIDANICTHFQDAASCSACVTVCPFDSIDFTQQDEEMEIAVGSIILASGAQPGDPLPMYIQGDPGDFAGKVMTTMDFELLASSLGPTKGELPQLGSNGSTKKVAVMHCAGSLREDGIPYCSGICCTNALKVDDYLYKKLGETEITHYHKDLVFPTHPEQSFYKKQKSKGSQFIFMEDIHSIQLSRSNGSVSLSGNGIANAEYDLVVLSTGLQPSPATLALSEKLNLDLDHHGFALPDHELLHITGSRLDGIYLAGNAARPGNVVAATTHARAVAGDTLSKLVPGKEIALETMTSYIDQDLCSGCKVCISVCPYKAISYQKGSGTSLINEAICRGCGTCTAACPSGASIARHFTDAQIYAEINGVLHG